ncbi:hypothetical protein ARMGADRAFT_172307 [Armillaria gallica]|uniref:Uncharacterized protein n=1 Tax=Armillaria gallica TaxID=47427 RepID=A0A2H3DMQ2_ARMGA|nr:hypothetical protein ARMGADRAFT_172307 [Armillaria gallica]
MPTLPRLWLSFPCFRPTLRVVIFCRIASTEYLLATILWLAAGPLRLIPQEMRARFFPHTPSCSDSSEGTMLSLQGCAFHSCGRRAYGTSASHHLPFLSTSTVLRRET